MTIADWIANAFAIFAAGVFMLGLQRPGMAKSETWQATVTPLASIIGSGFLVVAPLLAFTIGNWAIAGMAGILVTAYLVGGALRYNIAHVESALDDGSGRAARPLRAMHRAADLALAGAYLIAITFYLELLGAFVLGVFEIKDEVGQKSIASALVLFIGGYGYWRGLRGLEWLEKLAVNVMLAIIAGFLVALAYRNVELIQAGTWGLADLDSTLDTETVRKLLGAFLIVQGFETSRYLKGVYSANMRVRTMRYAQGITAVVYLAFIGLATVMLGQFDRISETGIIDLSRQIALVLPVLLTFGAVMSQFSSSVADAIAAGGLIEEETGGVITRHQVFAGAAGLVLLLLWTSDIFEVIAYASRAFAVYYMIQCGMAALHAARHSKGGRGAALGSYFALLAVVMLAVAAFAIPVETAGG
jgi:hypothetical protein